MFEEALKCGTLKLLVKVSSSEVDHEKRSGRELSGKLEIRLHTLPARDLPDAMGCQSPFVTVVSTNGHNRLLMRSNNLM